MLMWLTVHFQFNVAYAIYMHASTYRVFKGGYILECTHEHRICVGALVLIPVCTCQHARQHDTLTPESSIFRGSYNQLTVILACPAYYCISFTQYT